MAIIVNQSYKFMINLSKKEKYRVVFGKNNPNVKHAS